MMAYFQPIWCPVCGEVAIGKSPSVGGEVICEKGHEWTPKRGE